MTTKDNLRFDAIPEYCNQRLSAKERNQFEKLLREDQDMAKEYQDFRNTRDLYRTIDASEPQPSEELFARITQAVELRGKGRERKAQPIPEQANLFANLWQKLRNSLAVPWMLAVAQAAVIVLLLVPAPRETVYSTLSGTEMAATMEKQRINVVFRESATEVEIRHLLHAIGGSVLSGPSREGRYVIALEKRDNLDLFLNTLRRSQVVAFAEPVQ